MNLINRVAFTKMYSFMRWGLLGAICHKYIEYLLKVSPRKLNFSMRPQFNPTSPKMEKKITSQSPRIAVASYFVSFWLYLSHFKSDFDEKKQKIGLLNEYNITSHLASHQLVSQNCRGQLFLLLLTISQPFQVGF